MSIKHKKIPQPHSGCICRVLWRGSWGWSQEQEVLLGEGSGGLAGQDSRQSY